MKQANHEWTVGEAVIYANYNAVGIVYDAQQWLAGPSNRRGVALLLSDGRDLGQLSAEDADELLQPIGQTGLVYTFSSATRLRYDFAAGLFTAALHTAQLLAAFIDPNYLTT